MNGKQRMVEQSKQWLSDAFLELMKTENYQDISITEIAQSAQLSRKTFYHSFKNKEDLINYFCDNLFDEYFKELKKQTGEITLDETISIFLNFWWEKRDLIQLLIKQGLFDHMSELWQKNAIPRYNDFAAPWHAKQVSYIMAFQLGGFTSVLRVWFSQSEPEKPDEIKEMLIIAFKQLADSYQKI